ncbi:hypothetical protein AJ78_05992 [Emergomyces pasteurianus Ep9510]|uniref:Uncharacterized protein n=1 Tax=Emergomyces pasteurianus Ep9510 TaxID=1447872 RepID=A0A1J9QCA4_9EURO|nr:hypothetical protein AJ78_05992 [Emergomyces pasteurianus Ep9510]
MAASITSRNSNAFDVFSRRSKPSVIITLKNQQPSAINSYTSLDKIDGEVTITSDSDVQFEKLSIAFEGTSRTVIEPPGVSGPAIARFSAFHTFLRLVQPINEQQYPQPRIIEAGQTYTFPFNFVVPEQMLPNSCKHKHNHPQVHAAHTLLPPTLGDPSISGNGGTLLDDMAPRMMQIEYAIRAQVFKACPVDPSLKVLVDTKQKVRIIPAMDQAPPLSVPDDSYEYSMRKEKDVKKGALRGKLGRIVMAAAQPKAILVPASVTAAQSAESAPSTMVTVQLRFDPTNEDQQPPRLGRLWSKLKVNTFFAAEPWTDIVARSTSLNWALDRGVYTESVPLTSRCVASATWQKHTCISPCPSATSLQRRDSFQSTSSIESLTGPSASYAGQTFYTASVLVPISLPQTRAYPPTFHSCLSSRTYALDISLSYHPRGTNLTAPTLGLRLPIQVATTESLADAIAARGRPQQVNNTIDEFFTPRSIAPTRTDFMDHRPSTVLTGVGRGRSDTLASTVSNASSMAPPEYSNLPSPFARRLSNRTVVRIEC